MYHYLFLDAQYLLSRNFFAIKNSNMKDVRRVKTTDGQEVKDQDGNPIKVGFPSFDHRDLALSLYQSISKIAREFPCRKVFLLFDKSPYHRTELVNDYKGTRFYASEEDLKNINQDEDPVGYYKLWSEIEANKIKTHTKYSVIKNFPCLGMPVLFVQGYEADDLALIATQSLEEDTEKSALVSIDSDWSYRIGPNMDLINPKNGKVTSFDEMKDVVPSGMDLYKYHTYRDTFKGGHNDLHPTLTAKGKVEEKNGNYSVLIDAIESGDHEGYFTDLDLVKLQVRTFDIDSFSDIQIPRDLMKPERLAELGTFLDPEGKNSESMLRSYKITTNAYKRFFSTVDASTYQVS